MTGDQLQSIGAAVVARAEREKGRKLTAGEREVLLARALAALERREWDAYNRAHARAVRA